MYTGTVDADEQCIDVHETSRLLGVAVATLRQWRWRGDGPSFRRVSHRHVVYLRRDVLAWREARRVDPV